MNVVQNHSFQVDLGIFEVGIGGEFDITNIIDKPVVCAVSSIGYDHQKILGDSLAEIAWQKSGIFKPGSVAVTVPQATEAKASLVRRSGERDCPLFEVPDFEEYICHSGGVYSEAHVMEWNMSLALQISRIWHFWRVTGSHDSLLRAPHFQSKCSQMNLPFKLDAFPLDTKMSYSLSAPKWPGRFQVGERTNLTNIEQTKNHTQIIERDTLSYHIDGAHTIESLAVCRDWFFSRARKNSKKVLVFNSSHQRDIAKLLSTMVDGEWDHVVFCPNMRTTQAPLSSDNTSLTTTPSGQLLRSEEHAAMWKKLVEEAGAGYAKTHVMMCVEEAIAFCEELYPSFLSQNTDVLVTGSLYLVGSALSVLDAELGGQLS